MSRVINVRHTATSTARLWGRFKRLFQWRDCVGDVTSHLMPHLSLHPSLHTCSSDTILKGISELTTANTAYTSDTELNIYTDNASYQDPFAITDG